MAELKGVGPATASAILCAGEPTKVPFMADETMDSVPGLGTIAYTIPYYIRFATKVIEKAAQLKAKGSTVNSPHLVEKALWTDYMLDKYNIKRTTSGSTTITSTSGSGSKTDEVNLDKDSDTKTSTTRGSNKRKAPQQKEDSKAKKTSAESVKKNKTATAAAAAASATAKHQQQPKPKSTRSTRHSRP
ncbi:hypothetical protein BGZ65_009828 [Modicella reniformis]|uniref:Uncharacterized protein n=1 Tax=Modicella reniformis TaxID=1440133 RepID=A0A9P6M7V7_9FUNG|nr:hypothetical protein BGZ65_009828 [Modicella reniformis]